MRRIDMIWIPGLVLCLWLCSGLTGAAENADIQVPQAGVQESLHEVPYADGYLLVKTGLSPDGTANSLSEATTGIGAMIARDYSTQGVSGLALVQLPEAMSVQDAIRYYSNISGVEYAEPDYYRSISQVPVDPEFWRQWGLQNTGQVFRNNTSPGIAGVDIRAPSAWDHTTGTGSAIVAVLDTGVDYTHPDLALNVWTDPTTGTHGYDAITGTLDPMDQHGHGTHCAGIIGAVANNGMGGTGVAWNTTVLPIRWIDSNGLGKVSDEISGILWGIQHGAHIFSCSFGRPGYSKAEYDVMSRSDALFIIAAGNSEADNNINPDYPASYDLQNIISVAALAPDNTLASFSNYGNRTVHVAAPGVNIFSTYRSEYLPEPVWNESFETLDHWITVGNWTLENRTSVSPQYSVRGEGNDLNPAMLILNETLNLSGMEKPVLSYYYSGGGFGKLVLQGSNMYGLDWGTIDSCYLYGPEESQFSLRQTQIPFELTEGKMLIRFRIDGGGGVVHLGDIMLSDGYGTLSKPGWAYLNGTSMATPMVAGVATMIQGNNPGNSLNQIKEAILSTVDPVPALNDRIISGGRVNLDAALKFENKTDAIPVFPGWNHVSVPEVLAAGSDTAVIFAGINSSGHSILSYENDTTGYRTLNADDPVRPLQGYWLFSDNFTSVPVRFNDSAIGYNRDLPVGWSSVGGWVNQDISANETFHTLMNNWSYAIGYNASVQQYEEPIIRNGTGNQSDNRPVQPYHGYWLYCTRNGTYQAGFG